VESRSALPTSAYLEQFDAASSLWVWSSGKYQEVQRPFGGGGSIPAPVSQDACVDADLFVDLLLPYGMYILCLCLHTH
jgi:hypothetical protein